MARSYLPSREPDLRDWAVNFSVLVSAAPATYGLVADDAVAIAAAVNGFVTRHVLATDPGTRTRGRVIDKDRAKTAMVAVLRRYAIRIKGTAGVRDADKVDLGIRAVNNPPTRVPPPSTYPLLSLSIPAALRVDVRLADSGTPASRAKPAGAAGCQVFVSTAATPPQDYAAWRFAGYATRDRITLQFDPADEMKKANVIARWQTRKGQTGPWSQVYTMAVIGT